MDGPRPGVYPENKLVRVRTHRVQGRKERKGGGGQKKNGTTIIFPFLPLLRNIDLNKHKK